MNVVFVLVDALRPDYLGCYGGNNLTPFIDRLAKKSTVFESCIVNASFTMPSCQSIFSGRYCNGTNLTKIPDKIKLMPEYFREHGFATGAFMSNPITGVSSGFARGFDVFENKREGCLHPLKRRNADRVFASALKWIEKQKGKDFFALVQLMDCHAPYKLGKYNRAVKFVDVEIGKFVGALEKLGIAGNTVIVLTSDHGEALDDHGVCFQHGVNAYDELLKVPLIVFYPNAEGKRVKRLIRSIDILPTLLEFFGFEFVGLNGFSAFNELELLAHASFKAEVPFGFVATWFECIRSRDWKLIKTTKKFLGFPIRVGFEFFDLKVDPGERRNLFEEFETGRGISGKGLKLSKSDRKEFRGLGYL